MADYYPILTRAVAALDTNTGEARRAVYDRARTALVTQLRGFDPPLSEADIKRERLALEESIRRIETDNRQLEGEVREAIARNEAEPPPRPMRSAPVAPIPEPPVMPVGPSHEETYEDERPRESIRVERDPARLEREARRARRKAAASDFGPEPDDNPPRRSRLPLIIGAVLVLLLLLAGLGAYTARDQLAGLLGGTPAQPASETATRPGKIADRVQQGPGAPDAAPAPASPSAPAPSTSISPAIPSPSPAAAPAATTQRAILYEENGDPQGGATFEGTVVWRVESVSPGQGQPLETALRGDITVPGRMSAVLLIKRNTDSTLPASHTIEIQFNLPADFPNAGIANVPGLIMKSDEQSQGAALAGLSVRVTGGVFLIGLSNLDSERGVNEQLLRDRNWIDLPILYDNGRRAVLTLEKGEPGVKAFTEALAAWKSAAQDGASSGSSTTPQ